MFKRGENKQIRLLVFSCWISVGLCHAVRCAVHVIARRDPLDNMPATMISLFFAFLAVAFALFFVLKTTYLCLERSRSDCDRMSSGWRWFALAAVCLPAAYYISFWLYVLSNGRWMECFTRI